MNCEFAEKVSLLIDGELLAEETEQVKAHIAACVDCQQLEKHFLYFREQIKESAIPSWATDSALPDKRRLSFWKKRVLLPVPAFAVILFLLAGLVIWSIIANFNRAKDVPVIADNTSRKPIERPLTQDVPSEVSLSRFDKGGRAEIYTVRRESSVAGEKLRSDKE